MFFMHPMADEVKKSATALLAQGNAAQRKKDWAGAVKLFKEATVKDPSMAGAWFGLAYCLDEGDEKEANREDFIRCYQKVIEINSEHAEAHINLAIMLKAKGDLVGAEIAYRRAIKINPEHAGAHYVLAVVLEENHEQP